MSILNGPIQAQNSELPDFVLPTPNVAEFQKYGNIPVGHYTGVPNINIPIYTIKSGDIEIPISLNYHASGIKVAQEATWVGLGWSLLNAGGVISREIRGTDDLEKGLPAGYLSSGFRFNNSDLKKPPRQTWKDYSDTQVKLYFNLLFSNDDPQPDIYHFNFLGYSGTFIVNSDREGIPVKKNGLKINYSYSDQNWIVKTPEGWTLYFDLKEKRNSHSIVSRDHDITDSKVPSRSLTKVVAWHLSKIVSSTGEQIDFEYTVDHSPVESYFKSFIGKHRDGQIHDYIKDKTYGIYIDLSNLGPIANICTGASPARTGKKSPTFGNFFNKNVSWNETSYILNKIKFRGGNLKFDVGKRSDLKKFNQKSLNKSLPSKLTTITVNDSKNKKVSSFKFNYSYFNKYKKSHEHLRLKLDNLNICDNNDCNDLKKYHFKYDEENMECLVLLI